MLVVSWRLFACSREISSWIFTSPLELTCFNSSIFASSSAMGCSKSRNATAIRGYRQEKDWAGGYGCEAQRARLRTEGRRLADGRRNAIDDLHAVAPHQPFHLVDQLAGGFDVPFGAERECARGAGTCVLHGD